jgi:hypothetical protein
MIRFTPRGLVASDLVTKPVGRRSAHVLSRFDSRARSPAFWFGLWAACAALELAALAPALLADEPAPGYRIVFRLIGGAFAACGLIAWHRRPDIELALSLDELRELARGIHPAVLDHGLDSALESLAARSPVPASVSFEAGCRMPAPVELAVYFVASEALTNVAKYAHATSVSVRVARIGRRAFVEIADDGCGGADASGGSGLRGLADRVEALDGHLEIVSPPGAGTVVIAEVPCAS